jgi:hypothetical protein
MLQVKRKITGEKKKLTVPCLAFFFSKKEAWHFNFYYALQIM